MRSGGYGRPCSRRRTRERYGKRGRVCDKWYSMKRVLSGWPQYMLEGYSRGGNERVNVHLVKTVATVGGAGCGVSSYYWEDCGVVVTLSTVRWSGVVQLVGPENLWRSRVWLR